MKRSGPATITITPIQITPPPPNKPSNWWNGSLAQAFLQGLNQGIANGFELVTDTLTLANNAPLHLWNNTGGSWIPDTELPYAKPPSFQGVFAPDESDTTHFWSKLSTAVGLAILGAKKATPDVPNSGTAPKNIGGLSQQAASDALTGMRNQGGHAIRHLEGNCTVIPNTGSLTSRVEAFRQIALPILQNPQKVAPWIIGVTNGTAYLGTSGGQQVVIVVANEGPFAGKVIASFVPDANQLAIILGR